jgi:hypothetical protein
MYELLRTSFESTANWWFLCLLYATVALFIGVVLEERADLIIPSRYRVNSDTGYVLANENRERWQQRLKTFGLWLTVGAIVGEGLFEFLGARAENKVREVGSVMLSFAQQEATIADERAASAIVQAGDVAKSAREFGGLLKTEHETTEQFKKQATESEARLTQATARLDLVLKSRGPRKALLHDAVIGNDPRINAFKGQRVLVVTCLNPTFDRSPRRLFVRANEAFAGLAVNPIDIERNEAAEELRKQLSNGAHWEAHAVTNQCDLIGLQLNVNPEANSGTKQAAAALSQVLHDALLSPEGSPGVVPLAPMPIPGVQYDISQFVVVFVADNPLL